MATATPSPPLGLGVAVVVLAGATVVQAFPDLPPLAASAAVLLAALCWFVGGKGRARLACALLVGMAWACLAGGLRLQQRLPSSLAGSDIALTGTIVGLPIAGEAGKRFDLRVEQVGAFDGSGDGPARGTENGGAGATGIVGGSVRLGWYGRVPPLDPGARWHLLARLKLPRGLDNPGGSDQEKRSLAQGIVATGTVRAPRAARALAPGGGVDAWRDRVSRRIGEVLPDGRGRFVQALAVGDTRALADEDWERLRATGLTHQIAISGFHVGLVAGFGALLVRALFLALPGLARRVAAPRAAALAAFIAAAAYASVAGFALPTQRTLLMIGVVALARIARRAARASDAIALALIALLARDPLCVLAPGFWLSFLGVGWLLWCLPRTSAGNLRWQGFVRAQSVAVIGLLPLSVWFFGQASLPGPLANLLGVPVISLLVVPLCLLGLALDPFGAGLSAACWQAAASVMDALWAVLGWMAGWPGAAIWLPEAGLFALLLASVGAFWLLLPRSIPGKGLALLLWLPLLWPDPHRPPQGAVDVDILDVGHGLAVLVTTNGHAMLYDTGPASPGGLDLGDTVVVPALRARAIRRLDVVYVSHGDRDHAGGLDAVLRAFPGTRVLGPEGWARPGMGLCRRGQHWQWDGVDFRVLHPPPLFPYLHHDSSCVLRLSAGGTVLLLPGDIGLPVEARLVDLEGEALRSDLVLAPRHGGKASSSDAFIAATSPSEVVFSAGWHDRHGLPRAEVLERWRAGGATARSTGETGALRYRLDAAGLHLLANRRRDQPRYWRSAP
jgi:competence protein ComEC